MEQIITACRPDGAATAYMLQQGLQHRNLPDNKSSKCALTEKAALDTPTHISVINRHHLRFHSQHNTNTSEATSLIIPGRNWLNMQSLDICSETRSRASPCRIIFFRIHPGASHPPSAALLSKESSTKNKSEVEAVKPAPCSQSVLFSLREVRTISVNWFEHTTRIC